MSVLAELILEARSLSRIDKLRLIQLLTQELAGGEGHGIESDRSYPIRSPDHAFNAADVMLRTLENENHPSSKTLYP